MTAVILDINPIAWSNGHFTLERTTEALLAFLNAFTMLNSRNQLAVFASHLTRSYKLFPKGPATTLENYNVADHVVQGLKDLLGEDGSRSAGASSSDEPGSTLSAALSLALCHIHRVTLQSPEIVSRVLVLQVAPDEPGQHIAMMNCIFTAQRTGTTIDACVLSSSDSSFLQQACHLTEGVYFKPSAPPRSDTAPVLLQYLLTIFLPGKACRRHLQLPQQESVDLRASCFISQEMIDEGYVCSVCLSVFSEEQPLCRTCGTRFGFKKRRGLEPQDA